MSDTAASDSQGPRAAGDVLLYLDGVTVSFDGFKALNDLSLFVEEGELRTIIGPERRRQDDDDGRRHRQDPAGCRRGVLSTAPRI